MAEREITVGSPFGTKQSRIIMPIEGGSINGPTISGVIEHLSGADWVTAIEGTDFMKLDARYTIRTDDSHYLYIQAKGVFSNGPGRPGPLVGPAAPPLVNLTQDQVEWFTHINIEAGPGPYHWLNSILAVGVLAMHEKRSSSMPIC
ncbi:hypothetical protein H2203_003109 [Taxawa tesnikishii (nom. ined.)]|nr:hypothetical protein H2203_003109 [Dothideales sp. JES 119]